MALHVWFAVLATMTGGAAPEKVTLYLQEPTTLLKAASPTADVVAELAAGEAVSWTKTDAPKKGWFKVSRGSESGFVQRGSLSPQKPNLVVAQKATTVSEGNRAIATSGAANKSAAEEAHQYAEAKGLGNEIGQLEKLEAVALKVDAQAAAAHAKKAGLVVVVAQKGAK
jgi:hypothetical protein